MQYGIVKSMRFDDKRHGNPPGKGPTDVFAADKQGVEFLNELRTLGGRIKSEHE